MVYRKNKWGLDLSKRTADESFGKVSLRLWGRFQLAAPDGTDLTPNSSKAQGLLALLATESDFRRTRIWLQDKLWSDRGPEQSARSLRQELSQIKKLFGPHADILQADRKSVWLNKNQVSVATNAVPKNSEFLEGIDVRDSEFNHWLTSVRANASETITIQKQTNPIGQPKNPKNLIAISGQSDDSASNRVHEAQFIHALSSSLRDLADLVVLDGFPKLLPDCELLICVSVHTRNRTQSYIRVTVERTSNASTIWSQTHFIPMARNYETDLDLGSLTLISKTFSFICHELSKFDPALENEEAANLAALAICKTFSIDKSNLVEAKDLLEQAYEQDKRGSYLAWQAQILTIMFVERVGQFSQAMREEGDKLCAEAVRLDPTNSNVLAAVSNFRTIVDGNKAAGLELARLAVRANPSNPLAWWAFSNAAQYFGKNEQAYLAATRAYALSSGTRLEFWTAFQRSLVAMINHKTDEALRFGELSSALQPTFRPPLRYLAALYSTLHDSENGQRVLEKLMTNEDDFSIDRFIDDENYPVSLMRKYQLMDKEMIINFSKM